MKITTPRMLTANWIAELPTNIFTRLAMMMPNRPIIRKLPIFVRSVLVT